MQRVSFFRVSIVSALLLACTCAYAQNTGNGQKKQVFQGTEMPRERSIGENLKTAVEYSRLLALVRAAGYVVTLTDRGPYTILAPDNGAFLRLPTDTLEKLFAPDNVTGIVSVMGYHVIDGVLDNDTLVKMVKEQGGKAAVKTQAGRKVYFTYDGKDLWVEDNKGTKARLLRPDVYQRNGVLHGIDEVLMPQ